MGQNRVMSHPDSARRPDRAATGSVSEIPGAVTEAGARGQVDLAHSPGPGPDLDPDRERVAAVLDGLDAAVRQRRAELATLGDAAEAARPALAELRAREVLQEPTAASPRPLVGRLLAFGRKAFFHLFGKWYARPLVMQQNEHNRAVSRLLEDLVAGQERLAAELARLARRLDRLERPSGAEPPGGGDR